MNIQTEIEAANNIVRIAMAYCDAQGITSGIEQHVAHDRQWQACCGVASRFLADPAAMTPALCHHEWRLKVRSDSEYLVKGMNEWLTGWKARNWHGSGGKPIKNKELWLRLNELSEGLHVSWEWVKGHSVDGANEEVDAISHAEAQQAMVRKVA